LAPRSPGIERGAPRSCARTPGGGLVAPLVSGMGVQAVLTRAFLVANSAGPAACLPAGFVASGGWHRQAEQSGESHSPCARRRQRPRRPGLQADSLRRLASISTSRDAARLAASTAQGSGRRSYPAVPSAGQRAAQGQNRPSWSRSSSARMSFATSMCAARADGRTAAAGTQPARALRKMGAHLGSTEGARNPCVRGRITSPARPGRAVRSMP
jgi:hypothetical protein